ncbi:MAG: HAMP domain-containing histidine kinase, partial [Gemmatimonadota bacterium]|nr:HAMP domain-containing histidine kinase [Gemmatimonadota bacterium]
RLVATTAELQRALQHLEVRVREAEDARRSADEANAAKGQFLRTMSHELRTPLNAIGGYVDLLEAGLRGPVTPAQQDDLMRIRSAQVRLLSLINDVLNFAKLEQGLVSYEIRSIRVADVLGSLEAMVEPQLRAKHIQFTCGACDSGLEVAADSQKLEQILLNLLSNAVKFTPEGGRIDVSTRREQDCVLIAVADNGPGIPLERLRAVFQPFVQVDSTLTRVHGGSGLGLSISRELATAMGGTISVSSAPGNGATFTVSLPAADASTSDSQTV